MKVIDCEKQLLTERHWKSVFSSDNEFNINIFESENKFVSVNLSDSVNLFEYVKVFDSEKITDFVNLSEGVNSSVCNNKMILLFLIQEKILVLEK